jgi:hypothetical protein
MALSLASLNPTKPNPFPFTLLYGVAKVGKTALACEAPNPVLLRTAGENTPAGITAESVEINSVGDLFDMIGALISDDHSFQTLIIDSADGIHRLVEAEVCEREGWKSIEEPGYGKGYKAAEDIWVNEILVALNDLRKAKDMNITLISHVDIAKFDSPTSESYNRYRPNLRKGVVDAIQDGADIIGFVHHRVSIVKEDAGFKKTTTRGEGGGNRVIYLDERPGYIAGNRYDMPSEMPYKKGEGWKAMAKFLPAAS